MPKYFIDGGAHTGESVRLFREQYPGAADFNIISFEPNPEIAAAFAEPNVELRKEAIWTHDGTIDFYNEAVTDIAASCHAENRYIDDRQHGITVPCIDFSRWMRERFTPDDYIILKFDIEGSEYEVLEKMFAEGTFQSLVDKFYVEYHYTQRLTIPSERHNAVMAQVEACGLQNIFWHAARAGATIGEELYTYA